ncbi:NAD(P)/FAD-dependent oxidoreductase [Roseomonas terrae]|jgi:cation diffusion facilitator CzcD-associated flavoprotein CzcO|uniref:NAD(P)/FAD-dependent oxidoreductase n=1 Tax=Neoroseomonas terrae TaxID=424799 RepID=A0ABS5EDV3_9PROT|nr:NAD(P)/FAD-dependent oxidoreductase [Neoroseomonas terrae]MBR0649203.1 NAD(P)/FAD-dependent oxidoreductase [Neoroseomonas terrae]
MAETLAVATPKAPPVEHVDVLIVGAGISGIGGAYHLQEQCPGRSFLVLEAQDGFGGTWRTHRYPGIRSDSDLYTFGYRFKPWVGPPIATADEILKYMDEVIVENGLDRFIRYGHRIRSARWDSGTSRWTIEAERKDGSVARFTTGFLWMCQGYYRHEEGYTPEWPGMARFRGAIVHPQTWPDDLDYSGRRVVVIGSGATAATILPAMAGNAAHVTMLQRSPTYFRTGRNGIDIADELRQLQINEEWIHEIVRRKILFEQARFIDRTHNEPDTVKGELLGQVRALLGPDYDVDRHFNPRYRPWQQRLAFVPDADLFRAIAAGDASVVTDEIETFTETGILLKSGAALDADIVVTATGFHLNALGDIDVTIDGETLAFNETVTYRGMMFTGVPNMAWVFGYIRAAWTLRADMVADFVCRLLNHMEERQARRVDVALRPEDAGMQLGPWLDPEEFSSGYVARGQHVLPRSGDKPEWRHEHDYWAEKDALPAIDLTDKAFVYR